MYFKIISSSGVIYASLTLTEFTTLLPLQTLNSTAEEASANLTDTMTGSPDGVNDATLSELWHVFVAIVTLGSEVCIVRALQTCNYKRLILR